MKRRLALLFVSGIVAGLVTPVRANLIVDGSFETKTTPNASYLKYTTDQTFGGWTTTGSDVLLINTNYTERGQNGAGTQHFNAYDGQNVLDLTGAGNTGINDGVRQTIANTIAGQSYELSFYVGYLNGSPDSRYIAPAIVDVTIDSGSSVSFTNGDTSGSVGYVTYKRFDEIFKATSTSTTITFQSGTTKTNFVGLDSVSLVAVPEPSTLALGLASIVSLGGFSLLRRYRHRSRLS